MRWFRQKLVPVVIVVALVSLGTAAYERYSGRVAAEKEALGTVAAVEDDQAEPVAESSSFSCDGRTRCSEMTSCAEAMYFLENCPGVEMDGGGDGVPCERQWCGDR